MGGCSARLFLANSSPRDRPLGTGRAGMALVPKGVGADGP